jgi:hypothetical protein
MFEYASFARFSCHCKYRRLAGRSGIILSPGPPFSYAFLFLSSRIPERTALSFLISWAAITERSPSPTFFSGGASTVSAATWPCRARSVTLVSRLLCGLIRTHIRIEYVGQSGYFAQSAPN